MAICANCGTMIVFGGKKAEGRRFCSEKCRAAGLEALALARAADDIPPEIIEETTRLAHAGTCPKCGGEGPVDVHREGGPP